ncbi:hypothetical protein NLI96_g10978 [Meripilus lineatus]|uniref:Uncharacterized protein n=1 Tax=Meripilus lineatus TaxID=2056292 RepID=A0AAD5UV14_9APHY|nr:hypothetical protein NLI96_g10978 [Physisporinus lineatus]
MVIFSRTNQQPFLWNYTSSPVWADQHFSFLWEDMRVDRVDYDLHLGQIVSSTPLVIANQTLTNDTNLEQEMSFEMNESVQNTSTFEYSTGFTVTVGTSFSVGIPFIARTEITVDTSTTNEWSWGQQDTFGRAHTAHFPVRAGPRETFEEYRDQGGDQREMAWCLYLGSSPYNLLPPEFHEARSLDGIQQTVDAAVMASIPELNSRCSIFCTIVKLE